MNNFEIIRDANKDFQIFNLRSSNIKKFGKAVVNIDFSEAIEYMLNNTVIPEKGYYYTPSLEALENMKLREEASKLIYGHMNIQIGYCNGKNVMLDGLEYHKGTEVCVAATETVLFLGSLVDMEGITFNSSHVEALYLDAGDAFEMYPTTMHFCPCHTTTHVPGFKTIVLLPEGTNYKIDNLKILPYGEGRLLWARNEWQFVHPDNKIGIEQGNYPGLLGENFKLNTI
ncbi:MAG: DUF4867 family protein [Candidatus Humimicrobiaceae bacterium]